MRSLSTTNKAVQTYLTRILSVLGLANTPKAFMHEGMKKKQTIVQASANKKEVGLKGFFAYNTYSLFLHSF
jgi:hypothetical protein